MPSADELPDEVDERLGEIETAIAAFDDRPVTYDPAEIARAGVFVSIDTEGALRSSAVTSGRRTRRPWSSRSGRRDRSRDGRGGPRRAGAPVVQRAVITIGGAGRRAGGRGRRGPEAALGSPRDRADRGADAGAARQAGEHARRRVPGRAAQVLPRRLLPLLLLRDGDGGRRCAASASRCRRRG